MALSVSLSVCQALFLLSRGFPTNGAGTTSTMQGHSKTNELLFSSFLFFTSKTYLVFSGFLFVKIYDKNYAYDEKKKKPISKAYQLKSLPTPFI